MKAWYFSGIDKKLRYGDDREIAIGVTHEVEGKPTLCRYGLHGSRLLLDALSYAFGPVVWRVELSGEMDKGDNKIAAQKRTYLSGGIDITHILRKFGRLCALDVIHLWDAPDIVVRFLKTGDESLRSAALDAALGAAWAADWDTAWDFALDVALDVALGAARDVALNVTLDAARIKQNRRLTAMVSRAIKEAT